MGRVQYLTRLLLGRSPFESVPSEHIQSPGTDDSTAQHPQRLRPDQGTEHDANKTGQQYDFKSRPTNLQTESRNAELRRAQNQVLALIGVVEKQDDEESLKRASDYIRREHRKTLLARENICGDDLSLLISLMGLVPLWWADCLLYRIVVGEIGAGASQSFADVLASEWNFLCSIKSCRDLYALAWPGVGAEVTYLVLRHALAAGVEHITSSFQNLVRRLGFSKRMTKRLHDTILPVACETVLLVMEIWLLPLKQWSLLQRLHILPAIPFFPPRQVFYRNNHISMWNWMWLPLIPRIPLLMNALSPAGLMLISDFVWSYNDEYADAPILREFSDYRFPEINSAFRPGKAPCFTCDPAGWTLHNLYCTREKIMHWFGWRIETNTTAVFLDRFEDDINPDDTDDNASSDWKAASAVMHGRIHRSTALAHMTPNLLAQSIDSVLSRVLLFPLSTIMLRSVAYGFLSWHVAGSLGAQLSSNSVIPPLTGGLLGQALRSGGGTSELMKMRNYASHVGLAISLGAALQVCIIGCTYEMARWQGISRFEWGLEVL